MFRIIRTFLLVLAFAAFTAVGVLLWTSPDRLYTVQEWVNLGRFSVYDDLIREQSVKHHLDPLLVKAMIWRESAFDPNKVGASGERGLMQVGEAAGQDWAKAGKIETFLPTDLFDARTNLDVGTWYFRRAMERWKDKDDPIPFALAEYNAGASRLDRWIAQSGLGDKVNSHDLVFVIDFPGTKRYIDDITARYQFYRKREGL